MTIVLVMSTADCGIINANLMPFVNYKCGVENGELLLTLIPDTCGANISSARHCRLS